MLTADVFIFTDIDECLQVPEICELGSCTNIGGGGFYTCACPPGTISTGTNTDNSLRCIGKLVASFDIYYFLFFPKILMSVQWNLMCVDHWEHAPTMMVVHSMSVTVKMELKPVELETLSLVLVGLPTMHTLVGSESLY